MSSSGPKESPHSGISRQLREAFSSKGTIYSHLSKISSRRPGRQKSTHVLFSEEQYLMAQRTSHVVTHTFPDTAPGVEVEVAVPPLYHEVVTATINVPSVTAELLSAQSKLEDSLQKLARHFGDQWNTADGLGVVVAWGLPYFFDFMPALASISQEQLPIDLRASKDYGGNTLALLDAIRFPSDPEDLLFEQNHVAFVFVSDYAENIEQGVHAINDTQLFQVTSVRKGFVGSNFFRARPDEPSLVKQMAQQAGIPSASKIPDNAELILGFTSTIADSLATSRICNFESLGLTNQSTSSYFAHGTTMHLSHIYEDLDKWYNMYFSDFSQRLSRMHGPARGENALTVPKDTVTVDSGGVAPSGNAVQLLSSSSASPLIASKTVVQSQVEKFGVAGHSSAIQPVTRLPADVKDPYGTVYKQGQAIPLRVDFDTFDHPFFYSSRPAEDRMLSGPSPGVHFVVFVPTSDAFHRARLAQDGRYGLVAPYAKTNQRGSQVAYNFEDPNYLRSGNVLMQNGAPIAPRSLGTGFNAVMDTTHRQNFLVPPNSHRAFPLVELI